MGITLTLAWMGSWPFLPEVWYLLTTFSLLRKRIVRRGNGDHTHPCIEGKWATSTRGMLFINQFNFVAEVWYLLTIFTLVRKKHRTGGKKGDHIPPPTEGKWATSAKNMKLTTFTLVRKTSYGGEMGNHIPLIQRGNGPLLSEMWYLLTTFNLVRKKHRTEGYHFHPPPEGIWTHSIWK